MLLLFTAVEVSGRDISLTFNAIPQIRLDLVNSQLIDNYSANIFYYTWNLDSYTKATARLCITNAPYIYTREKITMVGGSFRT